jgi:hypothetical protein
MSKSSEVAPRASLLLDLTVPDVVGRSNVYRAVVNWEKTNVPQHQTSIQRRSTLHG